MAHHQSELKVTPKSKELPRVVLDLKAFGLLLEGLFKQLQMPTEVIPKRFILVLLWALDHSNSIEVAQEFKFPVDHF